MGRSVVFSAFCADFCFCSKLVIITTLRIIYLAKTCYYLWLSICCERATQPYPPWEGVRFSQAQDQQDRSHRRIFVCWHSEYGPFVISKCPKKKKKKKKKKISNWYSRSLVFTHSTLIINFLLQNWNLNFQRTRCCCKEASLRTEQNHAIHYFTC